VTHHDGHASAWQSLNRSLADDLALGLGDDGKPIAGDIKPARVLYATADREKVRMPSVKCVVAEMDRAWSKR
jgi:hypothetical protein